MIAAELSAVPALVGRAPRRRYGALPGFRLAFGFTVLYLLAIVILPLGALLWKACALSPAQLLLAVTGPRARAAYALSFGAAAAAATVNVVFGTVVAWVLARYRFPGRGLLDALVNLPFALPTAVAGIALTAIYAESGWLGSRLAGHGIQVAFSPLGITVALVFVGLPFVVRTVEPVLLELDPQLEEAAAILGANRLETFARVILPSIAPALLTGFALSFARALGEYGSVVFISGNMPLRTEVIPLLIVTKLEQYDYGGATAIAVVMLVASLGLGLAIHGLQARLRPEQQA